MPERPSTQRTTLASISTSALHLEGPRKPLGGCLGGLLWGPGGLREAPRRGPGEVWGLLGGVPGASWGGLGGDTRRSEDKVVLGGVLGPLWGRLGPLLGPSWGHLGVILGPLGASWGHLGAILEPLGASCGHLGVILEPLGASWGHLGASMGLLGALLGPSWGFSQPFSQCVKICTALQREHNFRGSGEPRWPQDGAKMAPRWPKMGLVWPY